MEKNYKKIVGINEAKTPIHHGGDEKTGSSPVLRVIQIYDSNSGEFIPIPYLHGNGVRGKLRRAIMKDLIDTIGYNITNKKLYHSLFSGGVLESTDENTGVVDLTLRHRIVSYLPAVSLFGSAVGNQLIQGKLVVGHLWPICKEYSAYLPDDITDKRREMPVRVFTDSSFITRRDDLRAEREESEQAVQMKVDYEVFIPGTAFYHEIIVQYADEIELSCLARVLELWEQYPNIGGRGSSGDGQLKLGYSIDFTSEKYLKFLEEKKEGIIQLLEAMEAAL